MSAGTSLPDVQNTSTPTPVPVTGLGTGQAVRRNKTGLLRSTPVKLLLVVVLVLTALLLYLRFFSTLVGEIHHERNRGRELEQQVQDLNLAIGERNSLLRKISVLERNLAGQAGSQSVVGDVLDLLSDLQPIAKELGMEVVSVESGTAPTNRYLQAKSVQIKLKGTYHQVMEFIGRMEQKVALFSITGIRMEKLEYLADRTVLDVYVSGVHLVSPSQDYPNE